MKILTEQEAAKLLNISVKTLQGWRYKGGGPRFAKMGRLVRYAMTNLEDYVHQQTRRSTSDRGPTSLPQNRSGFTVRPVPEGERSFDRPPVAAVFAPLTTPSVAPRLPTLRRHGFPYVRFRTRLIGGIRQVIAPAPRPAR
jgi:excisionase family DNA binding protein